MVVTPMLIVLICFIAAIMLIAGVHIIQRGVARVGEALGSNRTGGETEL